MNDLKHYGKLLLFFVIGSVFLSLLLAIFNVFGLFLGKITHGILFLFLLFFTFYAGFTSGKKREKNGYLEGMKIGGVLILILLFLNLIFFQTPFSLKQVIYYLLLFMVSVLSSMIGINKKKQA